MPGTTTAPNWTKKSGWIYWNISRVCNVVTTARTIERPGQDQEEDQHERASHSKTD